jgi:intracellular multiplication protein IcmK
MKKWCPISLICLSAALAQVSAIAADPTPSQKTDSQQALQQLRLLQQKLSQNPGQASPNVPETVMGGLPPAPPAVAQSNVSVTVNSGNQGNQAQVVTNANTEVVTQSESEIIDNKAFKDMTRNIYPLNPEQIVKLKQVYQTTEYAQASPAGVPPKPTATSQFVNLSPGSTPPVIRLSQGFVSSLVFLDSSGAPWPIAAYDLGDPSSFHIQWDKTSNTLMIQALKLYNYGNLAVRLRGLNTPVMLTLIPGQKAVDYRVDLRIQGFGPNAKSMPMEEGLPPSANDVLLHVLDGVPPAGSQRLVVSGGDARAWVSNDKIYVRTNLTVLSPGWLASMTSADGTHAYEMQKTPVLLVSWHGKVMQLKVEGL